MKTATVKQNTELVAALQDVRNEFSEVGRALFYLADAMQFVADKWEESEGEPGPMYLISHVVRTERDRHDAAQTRLNELLERLKKAGQA
jgi:hypothetical protein